MVRISGCRSRLMGTIDGQMAFPRTSAATVGFSSWQLEVANCDLKLALGWSRLAARLIERPSDPRLASSLLPPRLESQPRKPSTPPKRTSPGDRQRKKVAAAKKRKTPSKMKAY